MSDKKPIDNPDFWKRRLYWASATGRGTHTAIYDIDPDTWIYIQNDTNRILKNHLTSGMKLLDAGCGYGAASAYLPSGVNYVGVDISPDLIEVARIAYPDRVFVLGDIRDLSQFGDGEFDYGLCRSIRKMILDNLGAGEWDKMSRELLRVCKRVILIEYEDLPNYVVLPDLGDMR